MSSLSLPVSTKPCHSSALQIFHNLDKLDNIKSFSPNERFIVSFWNLQLSLSPKNYPLKNVTIWNLSVLQISISNWFQIISNYFQKRTLVMIIYSSQVHFAITFVLCLLSLQNEAKVTMLWRLRQICFDSIPGGDSLNINSDMFNLYWWFAAHRSCTCLIVKVQFNLLCPTSAVKPSWNTAFRLVKTSVTTIV